MFTVMRLASLVMANAQWNIEGDYTISGDVGIGILNPYDRLEVIKPPLNPYFQVFRDVMPGEDSYSYNAITASYHIFGFNKNGTGLLRKIGFAIGGMNTETDVKMTIDVNGNVGVGVASPNEKLTVNGTIYSKEVRVDLNVPGPDYVFEPDYKLPSFRTITNLYQSEQTFAGSSFGKSDGREWH